MLGSGPYFPPFLLKTDGPPLGVRGVVNRSVDDYYSWNNIKRNTAFSIASQALTAPDSDSAANSLGTAVIAYGAMTVGEKLLSGYKTLLQRFTDSHPKFEDFKNAHPIIGNIMAWTPGVGLAAAGGFGTVALGRKLLQAPSVGAFLRNPSVIKIAGGAALIGAALTSFWGLLAKNGVKAVSQSGSDYRATRAAHPDLDPKQLKQLAKATRNQEIMAAYEQEQHARSRSYLDPTYGVKPYSLETKTKPLAIYSPDKEADLPRIGPKRLSYEIASA